MEKLSTLFLSFLMGLLVLACSPKGTLRIIDKPITWNEEREQLSLEYLKKDTA